MKRSRTLALLVVALFALAAFAVQTTKMPAPQPAPGVTLAPPAAGPAPLAASCQRCGDGYCAPSCENEFTCPKDCKPSPSKTAVEPKTK